jgi:predicted Zn-dependent protease
LKLGIQARADANIALTVAWPQMPKAVTSSSIPAHRLRFIIVLCLSTIAIAAAGYFGWRGGRSPPESGAAASQAAWNDARHALSAGQTEVAQEIATKILATTPDFPPAHLLLGELAFARNELQRALEHFQAVPATAATEHETALLRGGMVLLADDRLGAAEEAFASVLRRSPENLEAHRQLARLATITGRRRRSVPHLEALLRADACDIEQLLMLADPDSVIDFSVDLERALARDPTDPLPRIGLSKITHKHRDLSRAMTFARDAVALAPHETAAQAILGRLLLETDPAALVQWRRSLPLQWADDPEIWAVFGQLAESRG